MHLYNARARSPVWGMRSGRRRHGCVAAIGSVRRPSWGRGATGEMRRFQTFPFAPERGGSLAFRPPASAHSSTPVLGRSPKSLNGSGHPSIGSIHLAGRVPTNGRRLRRPTSTRGSSRQFAAGVLCLFRLGNRKKDQ